MSSPLITIFVRHKEKCKYSGDEFSKRCSCKKHLRWTLNGQQERRATGARSWTEAEEAKRAVEDQLSGKTVEAKEGPKTVADAVRLFLLDKGVQGVTDGVQARYKFELHRFLDYANAAGVVTIAAVTRELLTGFIASWEAEGYSSQTRYSSRARLGSFLAFCYESKWIERVPKMPRIKIEAAPTLPLTTEEFDRLLTASDIKGRLRVDNVRLRAFLLLMRWSGLAVRDAAMLRREDIVKAGGHYRVTTSRQKTGTDVSVPLRADLAVEILAAPNDNPAYLFYNGVSDPERFAGAWSDRISTAFDAAAIPDVCHMKSHRLRDTFAVDLLEKGLPMEELSKLLGHETIRTTEKHYAKWVKGRQDRLDALVTATWAA